MKKYYKYFEYISGFDFEVPRYKTNTTTTGYVYKDIDKYELINELM